MDDYLQTKSELTSDLSPKPEKKKTRWWIIVIDVVLVAVFCLSIAVSINVIYLTSTFGSAFFVDGMSMYPMLNRDGFELEEGSYKPLTWASYGQGQGDLVDYGWAKMNDEGKASLTRFDIAITYFPSDGTIEKGKFVPTISNPSLKIKRIIGLPGEKVTIEDDGTAWGKTIIESSGKKYLLKNLYDWDDYPDINGVSYSSYSLLTGTWEVKEGQYFVMGDNRRGGFSSDSRRVGALDAGYIQGKAYLITSLRRLERQESGSLKPVFDLTRIRMPWNYLKLDVRDSSWVTPYVGE